MFILPELTMIHYDIRGQRSDQGFFIWFLLIFAAGNLKEKLKEIINSLMYQKQDVKVRNIFINSQECIVFKNDTSVLSFYNHHFVTYPRCIF